MRTLALIVVSVFWVNLLSSQTCFQLLADKTGSDRSAAQTSIESFACDLKDLMPGAQNFAVFDGGVYTYHEAMDRNLVNDVRSDLNANASQASPFYLLFTRVSSESQFNNRLIVDLSLDTIGFLDSMDESTKNQIIRLAEEEANRFMGDEQEKAWAMAEIAAIKTVQRELLTFKSNGTDFGPDQLLLNGFKNVGSTTGTGTGVQSFTGGVYDYGGYPAIRSAAQAGIASFAEGGAVIITDDTGFPTKFNLAWNRFESETSAAVLWIHLSGETSSKTVFLKSKANMTESQAESYIQKRYDDFYGISSLTGPPSDDSTSAMSLHSCQINRDWRATNCLPHSLPPTYGPFACGLSHGGIDATIETVLLCYDVFVFTHSKSTYEAIAGWFTAMCEKAYHETAVKLGFEHEISENAEEYWELTKGAYNMVVGTDWSVVKNQLLSSIAKTLKDLSFQNGNYDAGYEWMKVGVEASIGVFTGGASSASQKVGSGLKNLIRGFSQQTMKREVDDALRKCSDTEITKLKMHAKGCFVQGTPVLMAHNCIGRSEKIYTAAAMRPFVGVPVDDAPLLGWALANKSIYEINDLFVSLDDNMYVGLLKEDPYTSDQQRERNKYKLNDIDWYSVSFEGIYSSSKCHLALCSDWIARQGYIVDHIVNMNLPEQGISGPFRITSIKHILPQKKPVVDPGDGYAWKPITGLFEHQSNQIYNISFDNGEYLGLTYSHPVYSITSGDWRLAGELRIGERVLTYNGEAAVSSSEKKGSTETVYNLEVKDLHNYLVGDAGFVVHNNYGILQTVVDGIFGATSPFHGYGKCNEFAKALRTHLKNSGTEKPKAFVARLYKKDNPKQRASYELWHNEQKIADNGRHVFTIVNDKVYDNMNPNGMSTTQFNKKFVERIDATLKIDEIPFDKSIEEFL